MSPEEAKKLFLYNPETGVVTWRVDRSPRTKAGHIAGSVCGKKETGGGYRRVEVNGRTFSIHNVAWAVHFGRWPKLRLDHRNGDRLDNRLENLREAEKWQNTANQKTRSDNVSGFKGVSWIARDSAYQATIGRNGKRKSLGYFSTAQDAHAAYCKAAQDLFGEFWRAE